VFEIGNSLREARTRRGIEVVEAEQATKIRAKYLRALEDEQFEQLPAQTYVKGFLKTYAEYLGLDGQLYVDEYTSRYSSGDDVLERRVRSGRPRPRREHRFQTNIVWVTLVGIAVVTALVIAAFRFAGDSPTTLPHASRPTAHKKPAVISGLVIKATKGNSLLAVRKGTAVGRLLYEGTLERGQSLRFKPTVWVNISSPENIAMHLNGRPVAVGGAKPRCLIITFGAIVPCAPGT
jgi:hypothetical protein